MIDRESHLTGFTVAELIVAMSISAVTMLSGYELLTALKAAGDRQSEDLAVMAGVTHGLDEIREDLLHAVPRAGSGEPIFIGSTPALHGRMETARLLEFYSLCAGCGEGSVRGLRQMCRIRYELAGTENSICLYRGAAPVVGGGPALDRELIFEGVEQIQIAFHNGQQRESSFSSKDKLPAGVELTVAVHGQVWPLSVRLPCGGSEDQP